VQQRIYRFGEFELDEGLLELRRNGVAVDLQPKPFFLVLYLLRHRDRVVSREELMRELWPDVAVSEASLTTALHEARRALDDKDSERRMLATLRGRGYRFMGHVEERAVPPAVSAPSAEPPPPPPTAAEPRVAEASPFVDRESEMKQLRAALAAARAGERRIALVNGPPGIGKTRTASELALEAARTGFEVHVGRSHEGEGAPPFWPWIQILRSLGEARSLEELRAAAALGASDLVQLVPELREPLGVTGPQAELPPDQARFRMFDGVTSFIRNAARAHPLLLILDDLHWADDASLALLVFLARGVTDAPLVIVGTHRPLAGTDASRDQALGRVLRESGTASVTLAGLEQASVESILEQMLGRAPSAELLERVRAITGGNPFFVAELARLLASRGPEAADGSAPLPVPERLRDTVRIRVAECSEICQKLLRGSSAIGARFTLPLLRRAIDLSAEQLVEALAEAERSDLLYRDAAPGTYRFAHGVVRETLYEELGGAERMRLHRDIAEALEKLAVPDPTPFLAELAHHFGEAAPLDRAERAIHYARRAAARARSVFAHQEGADHCRRALEVLEFLDPPDATLRCELLVELAEALEMAHAPLEHVQKIADEALQLARHLHNAVLLARAAHILTRYTSDMDTLAFYDPVRAAPLLQRLIPPLEESLDALGGEDHIELRVSTLLLMARVRAWTGDLAHAGELVQESQRISEHLNDPVLESLTLAGRFETINGIEQPEECSELATRMIDASRRAERPDFELYANVYRVFLAIQAGDRDGADAAALHFDRIARMETVGDGRILLSFWRALIAQLEGRLDDAQREAQESALMATRFNYRPERGSALLATQLWWLSLLRGEPRKMYPLVRGYANEQPHARFPRFFLGRLLAELGRRDDALHELKLMDAPALMQHPRDHQWLFLAAQSAETCALVGDVERARPLYDLILPYVGYVALAGWITVCTGSVAAPAGALAATLGLWPECEDLFEQALACHESMRAPALVVWTQIDYARALLRHPRPRQRARGQRLLETAARMAQPLAMSGALERARRRPE
jgi:DNA-binding winged helix-turn-helix (wHTH) protein